MKKRGLKSLQQAEELNITAFLNLMVILVPFLLITAVFSRMTVLELNLPALDGKPGELDKKITLQLELVVTEEHFDIQDATLGLIKRVERQGEQTRWDIFSDVLVEIKTRFPTEQGITLRLAPTIDYKTMIKVMDRVKSTEVVANLSVETVELFPNISIAAATKSEQTPVATVSEKQ